MANRRDFIKNSLLAAGAIGIASQANGFNLDHSIPMPSEDKPINEAYWKLIRAQFPLSNSKIYLNNGTMGPSPYPVIHEVQQEMMDIDSSGRYGGHEDTAIKALAEFLNTKTEEITLTRNVTEGINIACWGFNLKAGDEVIMTGHEHVGHATPWLNRAKLDGIVIKLLKIGKTAEETLQNLNAVITKKTKVISVPHIPCTIGVVLPVKAICDIAKQRGIISFLDGAHPPGMLVLDIKAIGCDVYAGCCHKWMLGPKGTGFLYVSEAFRDKLQVYYGGGGFDTGWDILSQPPSLKGYVNNGHRYYYGTQNAALFKGIAKAIEFQNKIGREQIENRVKQLANYLQEQLIGLGKGIEMLTPTESISKGAQIAFKLTEKDTQKLHGFCQEKKIITRFVPENNINCLRVSTHIYNSYTDIDAFLKTLDVFLHSS